MFTSRRCGNGCFKGAGPRKTASPTARGGTPRARGRDRRFGGRKAAASRATRIRGRPGGAGGSAPRPRGWILPSGRRAPSAIAPQVVGSRRGPQPARPVPPPVRHSPPLESRGSPPGRNCRARWPTAPGRPALGIDPAPTACPRARTSDLLATGGGSNPSSTSGRGRRFRRAGRPRPGEESPAVDVPGQHRLDRSRTTRSRGTRTTVPKARRTSVRGTRHANTL